MLSRIVRYSLALPCALVAGIVATDVHAAIHTAKPSVGASQIDYAVQGGFELPAIPAGSVIEGPTPSIWTFTGTSGYFTSASLFGAAVPATGAQALYLMGTSTVSQTVNLPGPGTRLRLSVQVAARAGDTQVVAVMLDNTEIGRIIPTGNQYSTYVFDALSLPAGSHTLSLKGQTPGNQVAFLDNLTLVSTAAGGRNWSDPNTWDLGSVPTASDDVLIPSNAIVLLDGAGLQAQNVTVDGELHCADTDISLRTEWVMVMGRLNCGAPTSPYLNRFVLTLTGDDEITDIMGMGNKFLGAMGSGIIELHGEPRTSKSRLVETAVAGTTTLQLAGNLDWRAGEKLVLAPTRWVADAAGNAINESETVDIVYVVRPLGRSTSQITTVEVSRPLLFAHYAGTSSYANDDASTTWTLNESAYVGLLSRNIRVEGEVSKSKPEFGGHMMSMGSSFVRVSGTEFFRMGQRAKLGRYPFHWHLRNDAPGQYIVNSSVHKSFNRCITVHGTNYTYVADNVCYDFIGHGYFLEDGNEKYNTFDGNLGVFARKSSPRVPGQTDPLPLETDYRSSLASNGPSVFWIAHPTNRYVNNVAAGSQGTGFWYHLERQPFGSDTVAPNAAPFGEFDNNEVHASRQGFSSCLGAGGLAGMESAGVELRRLTVNHAGQGVWPCAYWWNRQNGTFLDLIVANTENGLQAPSPFTFIDSLFVAHTANTPPRAEVSQEVLWAGVKMYDQGFIFDNVMFANYDQPNMSAFHTIAGAGKLVNNRSSGLSFENSPNRYRDLLEVDESGESAQLWSMPIHDTDGSLLGAPGTSVPSHPMMYDASCRRAPAGIDGHACGYRYSQFRLDFSLASVSEAAPFITQMRSDGVVDSSSGMTMRHLAPIIADGGYRYLYRFDAGIARNDLELRLISAFDGDTSVQQVLDVPASLTIIPDALDYSIGDSPPVRPAWTAASSVNDLLTGAGHRYFHDLDSASLYVKLLAQGDDWRATDYLRVCMSALVSSLCPEGARQVVPPSVAITSPARVAAAPSGLTPVVVTADISHPAGIDSVALFVGDTAISNVDLNVAPYTQTLNLAAGSYIVRIVATSNTGYTYTALQPLTVGQPTARIDLLQPLRKSTYAYGSAPNLTFSLENWSGSGKHVHWFHNGVDQGDTTSGSVVLSGLASGRHDLEVALANADHSIIGVNSRTTIYVTSNGVLADFEEGVDRRSTFQPDITRSGTIRPRYLFGLRATSALDNTNGDMNSFLTYVDTSGLPLQSRYVLALAPAQNWTPYGSLEIVHSGKPFALSLLTSSGKISLGSSSNASGTWAADAFALPIPRPTNVQGIELIQYGPTLQPAQKTECMANRDFPFCFDEKVLNQIRLLP